ncbi:hypothetical protein PV396_24515 [Streptomyces sp. ME02-8801-2C]|uniref:hypothetical protein n=1 Tax=Streptomyces sp. ME02-8801-2C TaxID=3028680 RepID=UPI0029AF3A68|nr:hypothetical protein [Streptomyces sp. ME02-8801-2C]MDX3455066.1 hypothetical protein [Streptomyces sp. ME02-8801-2C]
MDALLLSETLERVRDVMAADPTLTVTDAVQTVVHAGITHDFAPCSSRLCAEVTKQVHASRR